MMKVKDVLNIKNRTKSTVGYLPYIEIGDIDTCNKTYFLKEKGAVSGSVMANKGELLISTVRPTRGAISFVQEQEAAVSNAFAILNINEKICLKEYLFYQLCNPLFFEFLGKNSTGATYPTCSKDDIYNYDIYVPSLDKQQNIVDEFNEISTILTNNKKKIDLFDELVKARFVEMFGEPLIGNNKTYVKTFKDVCTVHQGLQIPISKRKKEPGVNRYTYITIQYLNGKKEKEYIENPNMSVVCKKDDILMTRTGNTGQVITGVEGVFHNNFFIVDFDKKMLLKDYLYNYLKMDEVHNELLKKASSTTIPDLSHDKFYSTVVIVPPIELQIEFVEFIKQIDKSKFNSFFYIYHFKVTFLQIPRHFIIY